MADWDVQGRSGLWELFSLPPKHMHIHTLIHMHIYIYTYTYMVPAMHTYTCKYAHTCIDAHTDIDMHAQRYINIYNIHIIHTYAHNKHMHII